eukprot:TRINITY_DN2562_c0_g1_i4.p1 TRINITY_DN2562_c0_g1~~TRINITY_DN2562_c0_g1_i4.p1  ORF type:complete len:176 (+),score=7.23 TRINITY_DN2562_c0_g1_i4:62-529(+)
MTCLKPSIWVIFPVLVCEFLSYAIVNPSITPILVEYFGGNFSRAALITGLVDGLGAFLTLFSSPVYGALSDQYGRKPFLLLSVFGCSFIPACFVFGLPIPVYLGLKYVLFSTPSKRTNFSILFIPGFINTYLNNMRSTKRVKSWYSCHGENLITL